ncbi:MAG: ASCH domain-containing protein [Psychromonas sp.]
MNEIQKAFLDRYLATLNQQQKDNIPQCIAEYFCADEYNANECARLINNHIKRASCSLKVAYEIENEPLPKVGQLTLVLDWDEQPICIIQLTDVTTCPFNMVTEEFAKLEGEGDGSYAWWRAAHLDFFTKYAKQLHIAFTETDLLLLERFKKVFPVD